MFGKSAHLWDQKNGTSSGGDGDDNVDGGDAECW